MTYFGEILSLIVAFMWTITALASEVGSKRLGVMQMNVWRLGAATLLTSVLLYFTLGSFFPPYAGAQAWGWMMLSGFVGFFLGDYCLFRSYVYIGSQYGQLFMTLAHIAAALAAWATLGQHMSGQSVLAMMVTMVGIGISILGKAHDGGRLSLRVPWQGVLLGVGAGVGQGVGLVLSKIGMNAYQADIPTQAVEEMATALPFAANMIRCITGFACFALAVALSPAARRQMQHSAHDRRGMSAMMVAVLFGPFMGVGLSLLAVQHTAAGIASTLMALTPILIIVPSHYLFHTPITTKAVVGAIISCIGVALFFL